MEQGQETNAITQTRDGSGGENKLDSRYILKMELARFTNGLNVGYERTRGVRDKLQGVWPEQPERRVVIG